MDEQWMNEWDEEMNAWMNMDGWIESMMNENEWIG